MNSTQSTILALSESEYPRPFNICIVSNPNTILWLHFSVVFILDYMDDVLDSVCSVLNT